jgi:single stranded DNA-binding protein
MQQERIEVRGWVTQDAELKRTSAGDALTRVNISAKEARNKEGGPLDGAEKFYTGVFWGEQATEISAAARKGAEVKITGSLVHSDYTGKDGTPKRAAEIHYAQMELCKEAPDRMAVKGTVTEDPQLRETRDGKLVARLNVATKSAERNGQQVPGERWYTAVFWGQAAEDCVARTKKGTEVQVTGELVVREYEGKDGGGRRLSPEIHRPTLEVPGREKASTKAGWPPNEEDLSR